MISLISWRFFVKTLSWACDIVCIYPDSKPQFSEYDSEQKKLAFTKENYFYSF